MFLIFNLTQAQMSGNRLYKERNSYSEITNHFPDYKHFYATDSTLTITASILLNQKADQFKLTLGLNEEAENPKKAIENINLRIENFLNKLSSLGIKKKDVYVDFISQTKVYDFDIEGNQKIVTQKIKGFEIKKNIIINTDDHSKIEKMIYEASDFQIYDVIKIDYLSNTIEQIHQNLLKEAHDIISRKRDDYFGRFKHELIGTPIANSSFTYIFPDTQYQQYTAYESSDFDVVRGNYNNDSYIKKLERKGKTFYYEGIKYSGYDKVINNENPEIGIQFMINLSVKYDFKKNR
ncbi:SIMPL domain-containing protein [Chryseobacterium aquaeductus]|nr:SIMPL domain-containing protein [Chryseobacterium aquaeductus]